MLKVFFEELRRIVANHFFFKKYVFYVSFRSQNENLCISNSIVLKNNLIKIVWENINYSKFDCSKPVV
jgi:hypothetical protein